MVRVEIKKLALVIHLENRFHLVPFVLPAYCLTLAYDYL